MKPIQNRTEITLITKIHLKECLKNYCYVWQAFYYKATPAFPFCAGKRVWEDFNVPDKWEIFYIVDLCFIESRLFQIK